MPSPRENFDDLWQRLRAGRGLSNVGDDPVYYLIFPPDRILEVKALEKEWRAKLETQGWTLETFSVAEAMTNLFRNHPHRKFWLKSPANRSFDRDSLLQVNETLGGVLTENDHLKQKIASKLEALEGRLKTVLLITDLEALHPYLRVGILEQKLQGKFTVPTIILYPGTREGNSLRFLGIYPPDGNYRSIHIGG